MSNPDPNKPIQLTPEGYAKGWACRTCHKPQMRPVETYGGRTVALHCSVCFAITPLYPVQLRD